MNTRTLSAPESPSNSGGSGEDEERVAADSRSRPSWNSSPSHSFLIRLAMKVSRARWYSFLRRVFHYQNGSGSNLGPNPFNSKNWMLMEFIALAVQICVTVYTLIISEGERPVWPVRLWLSGYALGCLLSLIFLCWRYRLAYLTQGDGSGASDVEQQRSHEESRNLQYMQRCRACLELLYAIWFVMGNVWVFGSRFESFLRAPKLQVLCISLLVWNALSYSFPFILFVLLCCCVPVLSSLVGYNMNAASLDRGATDDQLAALSCWKFKEVADSLELGNEAKGSDFPDCCICLAKYRDKEEIRELPCTHIFHLKCVDKWLKITSCCPLCKKGIDK